MAAKIQAIANSVLDWVLGTGNPSRPNGGATSEVKLSTASINLTTGTGYAAPADGNYVDDTATFTAGASGAAGNVAELSFGPAATGYNVQDVAIYDSTGATLLYAGPVVGATVTVSAGETPKFAINALQVTES